MKTLNIHHTYQQKDTSRRLKGIIIVIAIHAFLGWFIVSGMARKGIKLVTKPLEAVVIQEVIIPPPPPPPPPEVKEIVKPKVAPKVEAPPPPFVPPPEVTPTVAPTAPVIEALSEKPTEPVVIAPPPPPPPPEPVAQAEPKRTAIALACPKQVAPEMPRRAIRSGITGVVKAQIHIKNGVIQNVEILSGPSVFHDAVKKAMKQYECNTDGEDVIATQEFDFEIK